MKNPFFIVLALLTLLCVGGLIAQFAWQPEPIATVARDTVTDGLSLFEASRTTGIIEGAYREGSDVVTFEFKRGERTQFMIRLIEGGGPFAMSGCWRNGYGQAILTIGGCVNTVTEPDIGVSDAYARRSWELITSATQELAKMSFPGLEDVRSFLLESTNASMVAPSLSDTK